MGEKTLRREVEEVRSCRLMNDAMAHCVGPEGVAVGRVPEGIAPIEEGPGSSPISVNERVIVGEPEMEDDRPDHGVKKAPFAVD